MSSANQQRPSFEVILSELKNNRMTVRYTEKIVADESYIPKAIAYLLGITKDMVYRQIVDVYEGVTGTWNAGRTRRSSIRIPGWVALTWVYEKRLNVRRAA